jgi:cobalt transporter subunit CbtB
MHNLSAIAVAPRGVVISRLIQLAAACFLGAVLLYGAGFAQMTPVHNAAHDMRHSQGFPCH